jgi:hypothetical protein
MAASRHTLVELGAPWDPQAIMRQYFADPEGQRELPADVASTLVSNGGVFRLNAKHRWMGSLHAEIRVALLSESQIDLDFQGAVSPSWWLRWAALPFRSRLRKIVDAKLDELISELKRDALLPPTSEEAAPHTADPDEPVPDPPLKGIQMTLEILSLDGRSLYQDTEGSL